MDVAIKSKTQEKREAVFAERLIWLLKKSKSYIARTKKEEKEQYKVRTLWRAMSEAYKDNRGKFREDYFLDVSDKAAEYEWAAEGFSPEEQEALRSDPTITLRCEKKYEKLQNIRLRLIDSVIDKLEKEGLYDVNLPDY